MFNNVSGYRTTLIHRSERIPLESGLGSVVALIQAGTAPGSVTNRQAPQRPSLPANVKAGLDCAVCAQLLQSRPAVCNCKDGSPPGSSVCGILQARILECVALPFSRD